MILFDDGVRRLVVKYVQLRKGTYYYRRRYPDDLKAHFGTSPVKLRSLNTKSPAEATQRAKAMAKDDDAEWDALRRTSANRSGTPAPDDVTRVARANLRLLGIAPGTPAPAVVDPFGYDPAVDPIEMRPDEPFDPLAEYLDSKHGLARDEIHGSLGRAPPWDHFLDPVDREMIRLRDEGEKVAPKRLSDALSYYLQEHKRGHRHKFAADNRRSVGHVLRLVGDWPLGDYRREHSNLVRDALLGDGLKTSSTRRHLNDICAVFNAGIKGFDLPLVIHPFSDVPIKGEREDASKKETFDTVELAQVVAAVRQADDALRHIVALLVNTGARLSEIVGLQVSDVVLTEVPHILIRPLPGVIRTLKTKGSERAVPLVGVSLWAARRAVHEATRQGSPKWLFPRYVGPGRGGEFSIKSETASASANKWLRALLRTERTTHCFRHTLRDRLRAAEVPVHVQDCVGGWAKTIGEQYGKGYPLAAIRDHLEKVAL